MPSRWPCRAVRRPGSSCSRRSCGDARLAKDHRLYAVRGHLLEMAGDTDAAGDSYRTAAGLTSSLQQQRYLHSRASRLDERVRAA